VDYVSEVTWIPQDQIIELGELLGLEIVQA